MFKTGPSEKLRRVKRRNGAQQTSSTVSKAKQLNIERDCLRTVTSGSSIQKKSRKPWIGSNMHAKSCRMA